MKDFWNVYRSFFQKSVEFNKSLIERLQKLCNTGEQVKGFNVFHVIRPMISQGEGMTLKSQLHKLSTALNFSQLSI